MKNKSKINYRRAIKVLLIPVLLFSLFFSCREELDAEEFEFSELSVKTSEVPELLPNMYNSKFNFSWTAGNNMSTNSSISYKLEIDKKDNNFSNPQSYEIGKNIYTYDIIIGELNNLIVNTYGGTPGTPITMQARVTATFGDSSVTPQSAVADFTVTPFKPFSSSLYIVGSASPNGWDISNAIALTPSSSTPGEFVYYGQLKNGSFKFAVSQDGCWCQDFYTQDPDDETKMVYNEGGSGMDIQWIIDNPSLYKVTVNLITLSIDIQEMDEPQFSNLWIVGDASPSGWNVDTPVAFKQDTNNPFIFNLECSLTPGVFKILAGQTGEWCGQWYRPLVDNQGLTETGVEQNSGCDVDNKWLVTADTAGRYLITLDTASNTIHFTPINVYMIGDATPNGWNMGTLAPMQKNGSVYTWTGPLTAGEFKFAKFNTDWCQGTELVGVTANQSISNTQFQERVKCAGGDSTDFKWKVTAGQAGTYTFTLNLDTNTLSIE